MDYEKADFPTRGFSIDWGPNVMDPDSPAVSSEQPVGRRTAPRAAAVSAADTLDVDGILKQCADSEADDLSQGSIGDIEIDLEGLLNDSEREETDLNSENQSADSSSDHLSDKAASSKGTQDVLKTGEDESILSFTSTEAVALTLAEELREVDLKECTTKTKPKLTADNIFEFVSTTTDSSLDEGSTCTADRCATAASIQPELPKSDGLLKGDVAVDHEARSILPPSAGSAATTPPAVHSTNSQPPSVQHSTQSIVTLERTPPKKIRPSSGIIKQLPKVPTDRATSTEKVRSNSFSNLPPSSGTTVASDLLPKHTADKKSDRLNSAKKTSRKLPDIKAIAEAAAISNLANTQQSPSRPKSAPPHQMRRRRISFRKKTPPASPLASDCTPSCTSSEEDGTAYNSEDNIEELRKKIALLEWKQSELVRLFRKERASMWKVVRKQSEVIDRMNRARNRDTKRTRLHRRVVHRKLGMVERGVVLLGRECAGIRSTLGTTAQHTSDAATRLPGVKKGEGTVDQKPKLVKQNALTGQCRSIKLQKFFGDSPPLLELFLKRLGYEQYVPLFVEHQVGLAELPHLKEEQLVAMGIPLGPRQRIINESHLL